MAAGIVNAICTYVANNAYGGIGCTVWDGEVARYDSNKQSVSPDSSGGRSDWPVIKFSMPASGFSRSYTFEEPYYDEGLVVCQIWHTTREQAEQTMDMVEVLLAGEANWTAIGALIPSPYHENPHYVVQMLVEHWTSYHVEGFRTQKSELLYTCELYFKCTIHGALPLNVNVGVVPPSNLVASGLLAEYRFNEGSGTVLSAYDANGNPVSSNNGTLGLSGSFLPTWTNKGLSFNNQLVQLPTALWNQIRTVQIAMSFATSGVKAQTILSPDNDNKPLFQPDDSIPGYWSDTNTPLTAASQRVGGDNLLTMTFGPTGRVYYNAAESVGYMAQGSNVPSSTPGSFYLGYLPGQGFFLINSVYWLLLYNRVLSAAEVAQNYRYVSNKLAQRGFTLGNTLINRTQIVCKGDSLTRGLGLTDETTNYPQKLIAALSGSYNMSNLGVSGQGLATMITNAATEVDPLFNLYSATPQVLCVWGGTNDLGTGNSAAVFANLKSYCNTRRVTGWKVVVLTCLPRGTAAQFETDRTAYNTSIRGDTSFYDALADVGGDATIGAANAQNNTTYYQTDKIHLTAAGFAIAAPIVKTALGTIGVT